jgi:hypothetical protein
MLQPTNCQLKPIEQTAMSIAFQKRQSLGVIAYEFINEVYLRNKGV